MPISCPITFPRLSTEAFGALDYEIVTHQLPMQRAGIPLGNQRFHLLEPDAAFRFTALGELTVGYEKQIKNLLRLSPLNAMHWINIGHEEVTLTTIA